MLMSLALAATAQCSTTVSALVWIVAAATGDAFPVAFVSLVMALKVNTSFVTDPAGSVIVSVATAVPGDPTEPVSLKTSFAAAPPASIAVSTADAMVLRIAAECVVLIPYSPQSG
jgi:hypothetical protein